MMAHHVIMFAHRRCTLLAGLPLLIDAPLNVAAAPAQADAIICIGGGTTRLLVPKTAELSTRTALH